MTELQVTDQLIGSTKVCEQLGISRSALTRWLAKGWITAAEQLDSGVYVFTAAEVARVKAERTVRPYAQQHSST